MFTCLLVCLGSLSFSASVDNALVGRITQEVLDQRGTQGTFILFDEQQQAYFRAEGQRSRQPLTPASTYKILNALIALETGVVTDEQQILRWDGQERRVRSWNQDQTLATAIKYSAVWAFQWIAREVGRQRMQHYLDLSGFGNATIGPNIDQFWLDGSLLISPEEQVDFLRNLYHDALPFEKRHMALVRKLLIQDQSALKAFSGKTGWAVNTSPHGGWFVGALQRSDGHWFFALHVDIQDTGAGRDRVAIASEILTLLDSSVRP